MQAACIHTAFDVGARRACQSGFGRLSFSTRVHLRGVLGEVAPRVLFHRPCWSCKSLRAVAPGSGTLSAFDAWAASRARPPGPRGASPSLCFCTALMECACCRRRPRVPRLWPAFRGSMRADLRRLPWALIALLRSASCRIRVAFCGWATCEGRPPRTTVVVCFFGAIRESRDCRDCDTWMERIVAGAAVSCGGVSHAGTRCKSGAEGPLHVHRLCIHICTGREEVLRAKTWAAAASMRR